MNITRRELVRRLQASGFQLQDSRYFDGKEWAKPNQGGSVYPNNERMYSPDSHARKDMSGEKCTTCPSYEDTWNPDHNGHCFTCWFWHEQAGNTEHAVLSIEGGRIVHRRSSTPRPGHGGLWYQGIVPRHLEWLFWGRDFHEGTPAEAKAMW